MLAAFRATDPALEESSLMSGATVPQTARRVTLPLVRPALIGAILISVVGALESFVTWVFTSRIFQALRTGSLRSWTSASRAPRDSGPGSGPGTRGTPVRVDAPGASG